MTEPRKRVLELLSKGAIDADEAEQLLSKLQERGESAASDEVDILPDRGESPKYLCIETSPKNNSSDAAESVSIRVPLVLVRAGVKLGALMPESKHESLSRYLDDQGIDLGSLDKAGLSELLHSLAINPICLDTHDESLRIYCR